jgi:hypothetical protein
MRIGEFAAALGLSIDTVRRLERRGLVFGERDWCGHRRFSQEDLTRARQALFAREAQRGQRPRRPRCQAAPPPREAAIPPRRGGR